MNVTQERLISLRSTALQVCELLRKKEPVPPELINSLEELASRKLKDQDPRMFEMFTAGKPVKDIAAALDVTPTSIYIHRRRWLKKNPPVVVEPPVDSNPKEKNEAVWQKPDFADEKDKLIITFTAEPASEEEASIDG